MARRKTRKTKRRFRLLRWLMRWALRAGLAVSLFAVAAVALGAFINPPVTFYMAMERARLGSIQHEWVAFEDIAPVMARSAVAAEDANFCQHWGFDVAQIRAALQEGSGRGASTISQQVVKNVYLWPERTWLRKGLEALLTPVLEAFWSKRRILEVYLNVAEFDEGIFGVGAASKAAFGQEPGGLSARQAAQLAAVLPSPKTRSAKAPSKRMVARAKRIMDGAATIAGDDRSVCFES